MRCKFNQLSSAFALAAAALSFSNLPPLIAAAASAGICCWRRPTAADSWLGVALFQAQ